ncbi:MAG: hypothetical protein HY298_20355 [Verrucomicrobia bacterium]|nr:hypothetical protein [Verrucomicrobiota bacterium]
MKIRTLLLALPIILSAPVCDSGRAAARSDTRDWERSIVSLDATRKQYDFFLPWSKQVQTVVKAGIVIGPREILTTADELENHTLIRLQKGGRGQWWNAEVKWIDYPANLAIITTSDEIFWNGLKPVKLADSITKDGDIRIFRWRAGNLESRKAEFNRFTVGSGERSDAARVQLELSSEIDRVGWSEPVVMGAKVIGLVIAHAENSPKALPSPFIRSVLEARRNGAYHGLGYFDFTWQPAENPQTLDFLKLGGDRRGVLTIDSPTTPGSEPALKRRDVLLRIDGFDIDIQGDYVDPHYGHLMLENISTRNKWAGDQVKLKIWRDGHNQEVLYRLPKAEDAARLVPEAQFDQEPEYLIAGGLVFQPLSRNYLRSWGQDWKRRAPFRLAYFRYENQTPERPAVVVLSQVLPDAYNLGYQDVRSLVVERVNGQRISRLPDLEKALRNSADGFHIFEFQKGETWQRLVLDAQELETATRRVLQRYGIEKDHVFSAAAK